MNKVVAKVELFFIGFYPTLIMPSPTCLFLNPRLSFAYTVFALIKGLH